MTPTPNGPTPDEPTPDEPKRNVPVADPAAPGSGRAPSSGPPPAASAVCRRLRDRLVSDPAAPGEPDLRRHLEGCSSCAAFAARFRVAAEMLAEPPPEVVPDPAFAARVVAALPPEPAELLGWAALRALPVAVVLVLVLGSFALRPAAGADGLLAGEGPLLAEILLAPAPLPEPPAVPSRPGVPPPPPAAPVPAAPAPAAPAPAEEGAVDEGATGGGPAAPDPGSGTPPGRTP